MSNKILLIILGCAIGLLVILTTILYLYPKNRIISPPDSLTTKVPRDIQQALALGKAKIVDKYIEDESKVLEYKKNLTDKCYPVIYLDLNQFDERRITVSGNILTIPYDDVLKDISHTIKNGCALSTLTLQTKIKGSEPYTLVIPTGFTEDVGSHVISPIVYDVLIGNKVDFILTYEKTDKGLYKLIDWNPRIFNLK